MLLCNLRSAWEGISLHSRLSLGVAALLWSVASAQAAEPLRIGLIGPFTGGSSDFGVPMRNGVQMAIQEINALGGWGGRKIEIIERDDKSNPDEALKASQDVVKQGVVATIGFCNTGSAMKSLETFQKARIPLIVPCATGAPITAAYPAAESYIFRNSASDSLQVPFVVNDAVKRGWTRLAVFADTSAYGEAGFKDLTAALAKHQLKPAYVKRFELGTKDLTAAVREAQASGANALFTITVGQENAAIGNAREALGWKVTQIGPWTLSFPFYIEGARTASEGSLMAQTFIAEPSNERRSTFLQSYRKFTKQDRIPVPVAAAQAYDAAYVLLLSMFQIKDGKIDGPSVKRALETQMHAYQGVVTTYKHSFSSTDHEAITENMLYLGMVKGGRVTFAYPEDAKRSLSVQRKN